MGLRLFWALLGVSCLGVAFAGIAAIAAIASGGYRPERYSGGFDPIRIGLMVFFAAGTAAFALLGGTGLVARRSGSSTVPFANIALVSGLAISAASLLVLVAWMPAWEGPLVVPIPIRIGILLGAGVAVAGMVPAVLSGASAVVRRGGRGLVVAFPLFAAVIIISYLTRS